MPTQSQNNLEVTVNVVSAKTGSFLGGQADIAVTIQITANYNEVGLAVTGANKVNDLVTNPGNDFVLETGAGTEDIGTQEVTFYSTEPSFTLTIGSFPANFSFRINASSFIFSGNDAAAGANITRSAIDEFQVESGAETPHQQHFILEGAIKFAPQFLPETIRVRKQRELSRHPGFCSTEDVNDNGSKNREIHITGPLRGGEKESFDQILDVGEPMTMTSNTWSGEVYVKEGEYEGPTGRYPPEDELYWTYTLDLVSTGEDEPGEAGNGVIAGEDRLQDADQMGSIITDADLSAVPIGRTGF